MKSIVVIIPYFGVFPKVFKLWWHSALQNPTITFMLFTDADVDSQGNIIVKKMTFAEACNLVASKIDCPVTIPSPYKLCDFKGAYIDIFYEYVKDYDFVGFGDVDLMYGNIRSLLTDEILENYEMISGWGHLTLYKNNEYCRSFYKTRVEGFNYYKDVFSSPINYGFDEFWHKGLGDLWEHLHPEKMYNCDLIIDDLRIPTTNYNFCSSTRKVYENNNVIFEYDDGNLYRRNTIGNEITKQPSLYVHFKRRKDLPILTHDLNRCLIVPNKVIPLECITLKKMVKWGNRRYFYTRMQYWKDRISNKVRNILK